MPRARVRIRTLLVAVAGAAFAIELVRELSRMDPFARVVTILWLIPAGALVGTLGALLFNWSVTRPRRDARRSARPNRPPPKSIPPGEGGAESRRGDGAGAA